MKLLVLGASGMLGNALARYFSADHAVDVYGTVRSFNHGAFFDAIPSVQLLHGIDVENHDVLLDVFQNVRPDMVVNAIGLVKQLAMVDDPLAALPINSLLPHRLARLCALVGARLVHISTDCVFSGEKGAYLESDVPDAVDLYGRSKLLGEVDYPNAITLRTSMIGHELSGARSLVGWFLSQTGRVKGYRKAVFSGLPTVEIARVIKEFVLPHPELHGVYHLSGDPVNKYELLVKVARVYGRSIEIEPDDSLVIDRSLDSTRFRAATGYCPKSWDEMIALMHDFG